jgi:hypothetical protein
LIPYLSRAQLVEGMVGSVLEASLVILMPDCARKLRGVIMKRLLLLVSIALTACDDPIPGTCKTDNDCTYHVCYKGICLLPEDAGLDGGADASIADAQVSTPDAATDAGASDAGGSDGGQDAGAPPRWVVTDTAEELFTSVWGTAANDVWIAGRHGHLFHWDGTSWTAFHSKATDEFNAVWGAAADDVWVAGFDSVALTGLSMHWDGSQWSHVSMGTGNRIYGLSGCSTSDIWAVSGQPQGGQIHHWDGKAWSKAGEFGFGPIHGVSCVSSKSAWASGENGTVFNWDGNSWTLMRNGGDHPAIWALSATDASTTDGSLMLRWNGTSWSSFDLFPLYHGSELPGLMGLSAVFGLASDDVWAVGSYGMAFHRYTRQDDWQWIDTRVANHLYGIWGSSGVTPYVWFVGDGLAQVGYLSDRVDRTPSGIVSEGSTATAFASPPGGTLALVSGMLLRSTGASWVRLDQRPMTQPIALSSGGGGETRALDYDYQTNTTRIVLFDGVSWKVEFSVAGRLTVLRSISISDAWAAGDAGKLLHLQSSGWSAVDAGTRADFLGLAVVSPMDVWALVSEVSTATTYKILHFDGQAWSIRLTSNTALFGLWSMGADSVWAVGTDIVRYNGASGEWGLKENSWGTQNAVWGAAPDDVWIVGDKGTLLHWDGQQLKAIPSGTESNLRSIWGNAPDNIWVGGGNGTILHYTK